MNIYRFNVFVADYLKQYTDNTGDWDGADAIGERITKELHDLINSGIAQDELFNE
jgi:hypothetical protein